MSLCITQNDIFVEYHKAENYPTFKPSQCLDNDFKTVDKKNIQIYQKLHIFLSEKVFEGTNSLCALERNIYVLINT